MTLPLNPFYFLRHGETDWNKQHISMGQKDIPLNNRGREQAYQAAQLLKDNFFASIAVSPLSRAMKTAQIIAEEIQKPIAIIEKLKEACWGILEGKPKADQKDINDWINGKAFEGAETFASFTERVREGVSEALNLPGPVLIVSHGGVYWVIQKILNLPYQDLPNCVPIYHRPPVSSPHPWFVYSLENE